MVPSWWKGGMRQPTAPSSEGGEGGEGNGHSEALSDESKDAAPLAALPAEEPGAEVESSERSLRGGLGASIGLPWKWSPGMPLADIGPQRRDP